MSLKQTVQKFEFEVRQAYRPVKPDRFKPFGHQGQWTVTEDFVMVAACSNRCSIAAPQQRLDPDLKLLQVEGLGQVVIGSGIETTNFVFGSLYPGGTM